MPPLDSPDYHRDSLPYRLAALRETFEESGILLARPASPSRNDNALLSLDTKAADVARKAIHNDQLKFTSWVTDELQGQLCTDDLVPFTRWVTPAWSKGKRFTTQMYLFFMPAASSSSSPPSFKPSGDVDVVQTPTSDGGIEHTAATFAPASEWLRRQAAGEILLFPPQCFLLTMVARAFEGVRQVSSGGAGGVQAERRALLDFVSLGHRPSSQGEEAMLQHPTASIPWTEKAMSPQILFTRKSDGRLVLGLDKPGYELEGSGRGGDFGRVVLVNFGKQGPRNVEVRNRKDILREERETSKPEVEGEKGSKL